MNNIARIADYTEVSSPPAPRKLPQQGRSRLLVDSIKEACLKILKEDGYQSLTAIHLADVAGVCVGSIYQYFPNIEAVVAAVFTDEIDRAVREIRSVRLSAAATLGLEGQLKYMIDACITFHQRMLALDEMFCKRYVDTFTPSNWYNQSNNDPDAAMSEMHKVLLAYQEQRGIREPRTKAFIITTAHRAILAETVKTHPEMLSEERFGEYILAMTLGIIFEQR